MLEHLQERHGVGTGGCTFDRDLNKLRTQYGIEIASSESERGYHLDKELSLDLMAFMEFLKLVNTSEILGRQIRGAGMPSGLLPSTAR